LATGTDNGTVKLWVIASGQALLAFTGHNAAINDLNFSPDGTRLATASVDGTVKLWAATSGRELLTLTGHTAAINGLDFSPEGRRLATASADQTVRVHALIPTDLIALARTRVTRALTTEECRKYLHVRNCPPLPF
jgi:WD40 repeat protein